LVTVNNFEKEVALFIWKVLTSKHQACSPTVAMPAIHQRKKKKKKNKNKKQNEFSQLGMEFVEINILKSLLVKS
jgi:hypothetical protein